MTYTPKLLTEQQEGELLGLLSRVKNEMGADAYNEWADKLILMYKKQLQKHAKADNPALIRLNQLLLIEERGFL